MVKIVLIALRFLYLGAVASKYVAIGLEKMDLFVYDEDDGD